LVLVAILFTLMAAVDAWGQGQNARIIWTDVRRLSVEGQGWTKTVSPFDRLPAKAKGAVPDAVWNLSANSAGIVVRFVTNAKEIWSRWTLKSNALSMTHMPATGVSGLDLYVRMPTGEQKLPGQMYQWVAVGQPDQQINEVALASGIPEGNHEFLLYLPLYNGVSSVEVGVPEEAMLGKLPERGNPIVFYGTSITQGGCASRPGMAYPAIIGRILDRPTINLGFSGNGKMDPSMADLLAELDAAAYVIDCCPNMSPGLVTDRTAPLVRKLRKAHPDTPIVLVENIGYQAAAFLPGPRIRFQSNNAALRSQYEILISEGMQNLTYVKGDLLLGNDGEATVDGTHATDLGFRRIAEALTPVLARLLRGPR